jgi:hypothetical protein
VKSWNHGLIPRTGAVPTVWLSLTGLTSGDKVTGTRPVWVVPTAEHFRGPGLFGISNAHNAEPPAPRGPLTQKTVRANPLLLAFLASWDETGQGS